MPNNLNQSLAANNAAGAMNPPLAEENVQASMKSHFWFLVIFLIYLTDCADRFMVSAVLPAIKTEFKFSDAQIGLIGSAVYLGLLVFALPVGMMVDRYSRKYVVAIMVSLWSAATLAMGSAQGYAHMVMARFGVGIGEAGYNPAAYALISVWYPKRLRGTMMGIFGAGTPLGAGLGIALAGYITLHYGWRHVFGLMAIPGFILAIVFLFAPDYKSKADPAANGNSGTNAVGVKKALQFIVSNRALSMIFLTQMISFLYIGAANIWGTTFLMRTYHLNVGQASSQVLVIILLGALGNFFGGVMSDFLTRRSPSGRIYSVMISLALMAIFGFLYYFSPELGMGLGFAIAMASGLQFGQATIWASLSAGAVDLVPLSIRGTAMSCQPLFQGIAAFVAAPLVGALSDHWGLTLALKVALAVSIVGCFILMKIAASSFKADLELQKSFGLTAPAAT